MVRQAETARATPLTLTLAVTLTVAALSLLEPAECIRPKSDCIVTEGRAIKGQEAFPMHKADIRKLFSSLFQKKQRLSTGVIGPMKGNQSVADLYPPFLSQTTPARQDTADQFQAAEKVYARLPILPSPRPALQPAPSLRREPTAQNRSKRANPCWYGVPDGSKCCVTCRSWQRYNAVYIDRVAWYVVRFPDEYQWTEIGYCATASSTCRRCVQEYKYHTLLVSRDDLRDLTTIWVKLVQVILKAYCKCIH